MGSTTPPSSTSSNSLSWPANRRRWWREEQAELDQLVGDLAVKERQLLAEHRRDRDGVTLETWSSLSRVERTAVVWFVAKEKVTKWKEKKGKERRGGEGRGDCLYSAAACLTVDTRVVSVYGAACRPSEGYFTYFYVKVDSDPVVRSLCMFTPACLRR